MGGTGSCAGWPGSSGLQHPGVRIASRSQRGGAPPIGFLTSATVGGAHPYSARNASTGFTAAVRLDGM